MIILKNILFVLIANLIILSPVNAINTNHQANTQPNPWPLLQTTINQLTQINYSNPIIARQLVFEDLLPLFDFDHISKHITRVIPYRFNQAQINQITQVIKSDIANILLSQLTSTQLLGFKIINIVPIAHNYLEISLKIKANTFIPIRLKLVIYNNGKDWKIVDVALNNSSLIQYYQHMILNQVNRYGVAGFFKKI